MSPNSRLANVETVPARPTRRSRLPNFARTGIRRVARSSSAPIAPRAASTSSTVGGSRFRYRSVRRTQPMSSEIAAIAPPVNVTTSVEPPPMSMTTVRPSMSGNSAVAPSYDTRPSSSPLSTSARTPTTSDAGSRKASGFAASRTADVATTRARVTCSESMMTRYSLRTASVRPIASGWRRREASTPAPNRVIRISRAATSPDARTTRSRVEFVPQSTAATAALSLILLDYHSCAPRSFCGSRELQSLRHPRAHRVVSTRHPPRQVRVQALDPLARPAHSTARTWPRPIVRDQRVAGLRIAAMALHKGRFVHVTLRLADAARRLEPADLGPQFGIDQPVARRHGGPVAQEGLVLDDHRHLVTAADHDDEVATGIPSQ